MSNYLYWSFQSSQAVNPSEEDLKLFQNKYKKNFETRELYEDDELLDKFRLNGWRNPLFSEVCSIILAYENEGQLRVKYLSGSEKDLLQTFVNLIRAHFQEYELVHFDAGIVLPYIGVRLNKNGFLNPPHIGLRYQNLRPWDLKGVDIKQYYKGAGDYSYGLEEIASILGVGYNGIIYYDDEFTYYNSSDMESLKKSAIRKIEVLSQVHRKLISLPEVETFLIEERVENVEEVRPTDWLKEIYNTNSINAEIAEGLKNQIFGGKKKPTKKDIANLFTIIRGVYVRCDFENKDQDSKATIEKKETEIKTLLGL